MDYDARYGYECLVCCGQPLVPYGDPSQALQPSEEPFDSRPKPPVDADVERAGLQVALPRGRRRLPLGHVEAPANVNEKKLVEPLLDKLLAKTLKLDLSQSVERTIII
jgi:hypothetical protein